MTSSNQPPVPGTDFGIFYPVGYIVAGVPRGEDAERVQRDLRTGGYAEADCRLFDAAQVTAAARKNLADNDGFLARLGQADDAIRRHLEAANQGASFLLIYAPSDLEAERAMTVLRRVPFVFAHRYHRLAIEEMR